MYMDDRLIPTKRLLFKKDSGGYSDAPISKPFLRGPIPLKWLTEASALPGKSINVGIGLWWLHGMSHGKPFKLTSKALKALNVSNDAAYDALVRLEENGLVKLERKPGQRPVITMLKC